MIKRVLITGGSGLLALSWAFSVKNRVSVVLGNHRRRGILSWAESYLINLGSVDELINFYEMLSIDLVIHTAALTSVEKCEDNPVLASYINVKLAENVAYACALSGVKLVHISTDHLFDGRNAFVDETEPVCPVNIYGKTKASAEEHVLKKLPSAMIVRTNFYCWGPSYRRSFSDQILDALEINSPIKLFANVFYTPILAEILATTVHDLVDMNLSGIFNIVGDERLSKYEFGKTLAAEYSLNQNCIEEAYLINGASLVHRPLEMSLSNRKVSHLLGYRLGSVKEHIVRFRSQEKNPFVQEIRCQR